MQSNLLAALAVLCVVGITACGKNAFWTEDLGTGGGGGIGGTASSGCGTTSDLFTAYSGKLSGLGAGSESSNVVAVFVDYGRAIIYTSVSASDYRPAISGQRYFIEIDAYGPGTTSPFSFDGLAHTADSSGVVTSGSVSFTGSMNGTCTTMSGTIDSGPGNLGAATASFSFNVNSTLSAISHDVTTVYDTTWVSENAQGFGTTPIDAIEDMGTWTITLVQASGYTTISGSSTLGCAMGGDMTNTPYSSYDAGFFVSPRVEAGCGELSTWYSGEAVQISASRMVWIASTLGKTVLLTLDKQ